MYSPLYCYVNISFSCLLLLSSCLDFKTIWAKSGSFSFLSFCYISFQSWINQFLISFEFGFLFMPMKKSIFCSQSVPRRCLLISFLVLGSLVISWNASFETTQKDDWKLLSTMKCYSNFPQFQILLDTRVQNISQMWLLQLFVFLV